MTEATSMAGGPGRAASTVNAVPFRRDAGIMALVGSAHFASHFFQLALAPLFPLLHESFDVSYAALGLVMSCFYVMSGACQAFAGILVDRYGARPSLLFGVATMALAIGFCALAPQFWMFYPLAILCGLGNSVFHPADLSILSTRISRPRLGRAYGIHAFSGSLGYAASPLLIGGLAGLFGWRMALLAAAGLGVVILALLLRQGHLLTGEREAGSAARSAAGPAAGTRYAVLIASPALLFAFGYFVLTSMAGASLQSFSVSTLVELRDLPVAAAGAPLTAYLLMSSVGMLVGGLLADRTVHHARIAATGLGLCALALFTVALQAPAMPLVTLLFALAGLCQGVTAPSRDILVKSATPPGSTGKVFGFVYSGLDIGSAIGPALIGLMLDRGGAHSVFFVTALLFAAAITTVLSVNRHRAVPA